MKATPQTERFAHDQSFYDVIISGAGPVGLFLACELALAHCSVLILEKAESPTSPLKQFPFGLRGLSAPTIEALYRRGLLGELKLHQRLKNPHVISALEQGTAPQRQAGHFAGIPFYENAIDASQWKHRLPSSTAPSLLSEMEELEAVLTRHAEALGVIIKRGLALTQFHQTEDRVTARSGDLSFKGRWLVGCDGSRSIVRKAGGFDFVGTEPEFTGYSARVDISDPDKLGWGRNVTPTGMYLRSQPGYLIIQDFDGGAFHRTEKLVTREHVQEVIRRISGTDVRLSALHLATTWTDRARQATSYRNGRILLAGDAAHIHSPLGGQGLNLGLGDAMNLGWKLAATIKETAPVGLLDSYHTERHPIGAQVLDWSRAQVAIMKPSVGTRALHTLFRDLIATSDGATYIAGKVWGLFIHYPLGGSHPLVGSSIPNFEFEDGSRIGELMRDGRGILLDFDSNASLRSFGSDHGDLIKYLPVSAKNRLGVRAALIRPDGIVAWASDQEIDLCELRRAATCWFVFNSGLKH